MPEAAAGEWLLRRAVFRQPQRLGSADPAPKRSEGVGVGWNLLLGITLARLIFDVALMMYQPDIALDVPEISLRAV